MSVWKDFSGFAVAICPFIAHEGHEITLLTGDYLVIYEETEEWYRGKNTISNFCGIFPKICCECKKCDNIGENTFCLMNHDLLLLEARLTIRFGLEYFLTCSLNEIGVIYASMSLLMNQIDLCNELTLSTCNSSSYMHLAKNIDILRNSLNLPLIPRSGMCMPLTISNILLPRNKATSNHSLYNLQFAITPRFALNNMDFQVFLAESSDKSVLTYSGLLSSTRSDSFNVIFRDLKIDENQKQLWLVIYSYEAKKSERYVYSCSAIKIPKIYQSKDGIPKNIDAVSYKSEFSEIQQSIHQYLIMDNDCPQKISKSLEICFPYFYITFRHYFGDYNYVGEAAKLTGNPILYPLELSSRQSLSERKHISLLTISKLVHNTSRKFARIIIRVYDCKNGSFLNVFKDQFPDQTDSSIWKSPIFIGSKEMSLSENITLDFSDSKYQNISYEKLFLVFEIQRSSVFDSSLSTAYYSFCSMSRNPDSIPLFEYGKNMKIDSPQTYMNSNQPAKSIGTLSFTLISYPLYWKLPSTINNLLLYNRNKQDIVSIIQAIAWTDQEWTHFLTPIVSTLFQIITHLADAESAAYQVLLFIFDEKKESIENILTDISKEIKYSFANEYFCLNGLYPHLISQMIITFSSMSHKDAQRNMYCFPFLIQVSMLSFSIDSNPSKDVKAYTQSTLAVFFDNLLSVFSDFTLGVSEELYIFIMKRTIPLFELIYKCFEFEKASNISQQLVRAVYENRESYPSSLFHQNVTKFLYSSLSHVISCCKHHINDFIPSILYLITQEWHMKDYEYYIFRILHGLISNHKDLFIEKVLSYLNTSLKADETGNSRQVQKMILYYFPETISTNEFVSLIQNLNANPSEMLFLSLNFLNKNSKKVFDEIRDPDFSIQIKSTIFIEIITLTLYSSTPSGILLDFDTQTYIYQQNHDLSVLCLMLDNYPESISLPKEIFEIIFRSYAMNPSNGLRDFFISLINREIGIEENRAELYKLLLKDLSLLVIIPNYPRVYELFSTVNKDLDGFCTLFRNCAKSFHNIKYLQQNHENLIALADSYVNLSEAYKIIGNSTNEKSNIQYLFEMYKSLNSCIEKSFALQYFLEFLPLDLEEAASFMGISESTNFHIHIHALYDIIEWLMDYKTYDLCMVIMSIIKDKLVDPYDQFEMLIKFYQIESQVFENIANHNSSHSQYVGVFYNGNIFDVFENNQKFIYRFPSSISFESIVEMFSSKYKNTTIKHEYFIDDDEICIVLVQVTPVHLSEVQIPYFIETVRPIQTNVFVVESHNQVQSIFYIKYPLPGIRLREKVINTQHRIIDSKERAIKLFYTTVNMLKVDSDFLSSRLDNKILISSDNIERLLIMVNECVSSCLNGEFRDYFEQYFTASNKGDKFYSALTEASYLLFNSLKESIEVLNPIVNNNMKSILEMIELNLGVAKRMLEELINQ